MFSVGVRLRGGPHSTPPILSPSTHPQPTHTLGTCKLDLHLSLFPNSPWHVSGLPLLLRKQLLLTKPLIQIWSFGSPQTTLQYP